MKIIPVILAGGAGSRLWPISREQHPKQYLKFFGNNTMLQETILRLKGLKNVVDPIIVCNTKHRFLVAEQCQQIKVINPTIILEPLGKNTAPAITAASIYALEKNKNSILLVLSADHVIKNIKNFHHAIRIAKIEAEQDKILTFGIVPTNANTGYGYIKINKNNKSKFFKVEKFVEKPDIKSAKKYINEGNFLWNSGMFMFKSQVLIDELTKYAPSITNSVFDSYNNSKQDMDFIRLDKIAFEACPNNSIDYALMEKSKNVFLVPLNAGWSDVGSWSTMYDVNSKDKDGNVIKGDVILKETSNSLIYSPNHFISSIGIDNMIIVHTPDATLIAHKDKADEIKSIVSSLNEKDRYEAHSNRKVYRPWGWYDSLQLGKNFQVKRLNVKPAGKLSLQKHFKRAEHWVVITGTATVVNGDKQFELKEGQSTYIAVCSIHSLENKTDEKLEIIEVQSGSYLGEDDIVRYEDKYGRKTTKIKLT